MSGLEGGSDGGREGVVVVVVVHCGWLDGVGGREC